jgi:hypothetical protein
MIRQWGFILPFLFLVFAVVVVGASLAVLFWPFVIAQIVGTCACGAEWWHRLHQ